MKNKKLFAVVFVLSNLILAMIFKFVDFFYYKSMSNLIDLESYGYYDSMIIYKDKKFVYILIGAISFIVTLIFTIFYNKIESNFEKRQDKIRKKLRDIALGDYAISIDEVNTLGVMYDELYKLVLELRESKELATKDKIKLKEYLDDISHQLKTPISSIEILLELSRKNGENYNEKIGEEISKIEYLVTSILTLARMDVNQINFESEEFSVLEAIYASVESIEPQILKKSVLVEISGDDFQINGDFYWIVEAFINIIKNSVEYCDKKVNITTSKTKVYSEVVIKDDGEGFSNKDLNELFHRFYKSDKSKNGVGIGLNLSKNILEKHNATISAENEMGGKFIIKFYP